MNAQRWEDIESLFHGALARPPLERASFLEERCAGDDELKLEATSLLEAYLEAADFIEEPAIAEDAQLLLGDGALDKTDHEIGPYRIIERLGGGGMGEVYLAEDTRLGRLVALKLLPPYFASDDNRLRRFQSEARAASALNHPNILTIYEVGESDSNHFIATEFIEGQTISDLIRERKLSLEEILKIIEQIASALSVAHAAGIVHRDIKPENIMVRPDGFIKILDFGIAKLLETEPLGTSRGVEGSHSQTEHGLLLGTVFYMSPEQARGLKVDERTDIWSLGVVLYQMLTGRLPFHAPTNMDTVVAILSREPAGLSEAAKDHYSRAPYLQLIVDKCLAKDVSGRYQSLGELLDDIEKCLPGSGALLAAKKRTRYAWIAGVLLILAITAVALPLLYRRYSSSSPAVAQTVRHAKPYKQMSEREQLDFVAAEELHISNMMSRREEKLNDDAVRLLKTYVDYYVSKTEAMSGVYERAQPLVPVIARSFAAQKVPVVIGIYLPVIESGYRTCYVSDHGATGLFQMLPGTAERYGLPRREMCDLEKMSPVAAHYIADRMAELGEDANSVTLVLLSYNRGDEWVRDTLRQLRGTEGYERSFWALFANEQTREKMFPDNDTAYVPSFFAAAIIGENPEVFGLHTRPLSSLAKLPD